MSVQSLGLEDPLEEEMASHLSILTRKTLYPEELQFIGLQRVRHDLATEQQQQKKLIFFGILIL